MFSLQNAQSLVGIATVLLICWGISENRARFPWKLAIGNGQQMRLVLVDLPNATTMAIAIASDASQYATLRDRAAPVIDSLTLTAVP